MKQKIIDKGLYIQIMQCSLEVRMEKTRLNLLIKSIHGERSEKWEKSFFGYCGGFVCNPF